jgi:esterase/lipase
MTIYAIPGLATTGRLFEHLKIKDCEIKILDWPQPGEEMNLQDYAKLFLKEIDTNKPFCLLGVSFGGMLCSELSHMVNAQKVFLISSCKNKHELPRMIRIQKYVSLYNLFSEKFLIMNAFKFHWLLGFKKEYKGIFKEMIAQMPEHYIKRSIKMIVNWENTKMPKNCIHIHGNNDHLLFYSCVKADYTIQNGSHAMIVYQAQEINALLETLI